MKAKEFIDKYYLHDSLFNKVSFSKEEAVVTMIIDFAFWMQSWFKEGMDETGLIFVTFHNVEDYSCPDSVDWEQISILQTEETDGLVKFSLMNDMDDSYLEMKVKSDDIDVEILAEGED